MPPGSQALAVYEERAMRTGLVLSVLLIASIGTAAAQTQITTGVIQGTVADPTGSTLPGVSVEVRNVDTNLARTQVTEADGRFVFLQLPPGPYKVTFALSGFATLVQENLVLTVGQAITLPAVMRVSGVAEMVTVTTSA
ncbi:MAG: carboxypeptidase-like regulatory domain-containing protein, partial [Vicinamibacterales bacterium]